MPIDWARTCFRYVVYGISSVLFGYKKLPVCSFSDVTTEIDTALEKDRRLQAFGSKLYDHRFQSAVIQRRNVERLLLDGLSQRSDLEEGAALRTKNVESNLLDSTRMHSTSRRRHSTDFRRARCKHHILRHSRSRWSRRRIGEVCDPFIRQSHHHYGR
jgi:hypothetical protein